MKKLALFIGIVMISCWLSAQTIVSGNVTGVWEPDGNPYIVTGDVYVVDFLAIEAGVNVKFQAGGWMIEIGSGDTFLADGTYESPIIFEPYQGNEPGLWDKIYFNSSQDNDTLRYCKIKGANIGIHTHTSKTVIYGCDISYCLTGIYVTNYAYSSYGKATIINCSSFGNSTGVHVDGYYGPLATVINSIFSFNNIFGIRNSSVGPFSAQDILYNCFWGNGINNFSGISFPTGFGSNGNYQNFSGDSCDIYFNIYNDPMFVDTVNNNFSLQPGSKCIDAGTNLILGQFTYDPDGTMPDMGANYYPHSNAAILTYSFTEQTSPAFINPVNQDITIEVVSGTDVTDLIADFNLSGGATTTVNGIQQISGETSNDFTFPITYIVTSNGGTNTQNWLVTVIVAPNDETNILEYSFGIPPQTGVAIIDLVAHTIEIEVEYETDVTDLVATFIISNGANAAVGGVAQQSGVTSNDFTYPVNYFITAEDGVTVQDWIVTVVSIAPNTETDILAYSFPEQTGLAVINPGDYTVDIEVEYGTDVTNLVATFLLSEGAAANVNGIDQISGISQNDFTYPVTYVITAEDQLNVQNWVVNVSIALNSETDILAYSFAEQTGPAIINSTIHTVDIEVEYGTDLTNLVATFLLSDGASAKVNGIVQISGVTQNDFTYTVTYAITAEDQLTVQNWVVNVSIALNSETNILAYSFAEQTAPAIINSTIHTVDIEVEYGTDVTNLVATFVLSDGATANVNGIDQISGITQNDYTYPVTYVITAEDQLTAQNWVVNVSIALNSETDILTYSFAEQTGPAIINSTIHTVDIEVEYGTDLTNLVATFLLSDGASAKVNGIVQISGVTQNDFTYTVTYAITAEDQLTVQNWVVNVSIALNSETYILAYSFAEQTTPALINSTIHTVDIEVEYGTDVTNLVATFLLSEGASAKVNGIDQISGVTQNDFTYPVTYVITAENQITVQNWMVNVSIALNSETDILVYSFTEQTAPALINSTIHTVDIEVEYGTDVTNLVATFLLSEGASAKVNGIDQISGITQNDFTYPVNYVITSENGLNVQDWLVTVDVYTGINDNFAGKAITYPNPYSSRTTIYFNNPFHQDYSLSIFDLGGKVVQKVNQIKSSYYEFERGSLPNGVYLLELKGEKVYSGKMVIR